MTSLKKQTQERPSMSIWYQLLICSMACGALALFLPNPSELSAKHSKHKPQKKKISWKRMAKDAWQVTRHMASTNWFDKKTLHYVKNSALTPVIGTNFGRIGNSFYRSCQPSKRQFKRYLRKYPIRTSINLRDNALGTSWWRKQQIVTQNHNSKNPQNPVKLHNITMSSRTLPEPDSIKKLLAIYHDKSAHPIHVNCHFGRDRTGLASALYVLEVQHKNLSEALKEFEFLKYGHIEKHMPRMKQFIRTWHTLREKQNYSTCPKAICAALENYAQHYKNDNRA